MIDAIFSQVKGVILMVAKGPVQVALKDIAEMKKQHPCGSNRWEIIRTGMDIGMKCLGCGHFVLIPRVKFEKSLKKLVPFSPEE